MTFFPDRVSAVVFDIGGVFLYPDDGPVAEALSTMGIAEQEPGPGRFYRAHHAGVHALAQEAEAAANTEAGRPDEHDAGFWSIYDQSYARSLGVPEDRLNELAPAIRQGWDLAHPENIAAFHRLAGSGMPVAIVSNNNGTAPEQMQRHGVCQVLPDGPLPQVKAIIDSALVGVAKPDPIIMVPAIYALGLPASEILYVGDTVQADVAAANAAGMQVVQLDPFDHHQAWDERPDAHTRLPDVSAIVDRVSGR